MDLNELEGRTYGPLPWLVSPDSVRDFVALTGDGSGQWVEFAPPGFAAAALFSVAPELLSELYDHSVVHGEQTFTWHRPFPLGDRFEVTGVVTKVRERGGVHFVTFEMEAGDAGGVVMTGKSLFLASGESLAAGQGGFERPEPPHSYRGDPGAGEIGASRADLIKYASATRDWNPVHWDHEAGVAAGFPGIVVHGLLQAGWALRAAGGATGGGAAPFATARFRFRSPLLPARPVRVTAGENNGIIEVVLADDDAEYLTASIERLSDE